MVVVIGSGGLRTRLWLWFARYRQRLMMEVRVLLLCLFLSPLYHVLCRGCLSPDLLVVVTVDNPLQHHDTHAETPLHHLVEFVPQHPYPQTETNSQSHSPQLSLAQTTQKEPKHLYGNVLFAPLKRPVRLCCHRVGCWLCLQAGLS